MGNDALWMRLRAVQWSQYQTSNGNATKLPKQLQYLASKKSKRSMKASHEIWQALCKEQLHSAAIVVLPFLSEIAMISQPEIAAEIEDIFERCKQLADGTEPWHSEVLQFLGSSS